MNRLSINILRVSIGIIYLWYGALKFFPSLSPAEELAKSTIEVVTFHGLSVDTMYYILAVWECVLGILLIANLWTKQVVILLFCHMFCTMLPLVIFPKVTFTEIPYGLSFTGQYIMKNLVIISGALVVLCNSQKQAASKTSKPLAHSNENIIGEVKTKFDI